ncbi:unnamed protein product [Paramecium primaurelia]|uniref:Uncharacterized protein n=1 Tax=Paramecium primaurelia TaxID=5886 RepID=A0A8S1MEV1_PARPR|nr:unnamed protein product [Paramecium primaurelia]
MLNKENNIIFLQAIQEKQYNKAYKIGSQILNKNPNEQSIKRFMIFLQNNLQDCNIFIQFLQIIKVKKKMMKRKNMNMNTKKNMNKKDKMQIRKYNQS